MPHVQVVRSMMNPRDLAELQRIEHQTGKPVRDEPEGAVLILKFRAERMRRMSAKIKDSRQPLGRFLWDVKISRDV